MVVPSSTEHDVEVGGVELDAEDSLRVRLLVVVETLHELDAFDDAVLFSCLRVVDAHVDVSAASGEDLSATVEVETLNVVAFDVCFDICVLRFWRSTLFSDVNTVLYRSPRAHVPSTMIFVVLFSVLQTSTFPFPVLM